MHVIPSRFAPYLYALLRIVAGLLFMFHGTQKILGWPGGRGPVNFVSRAGAAGFIELIGGFLIAVGLFTSVAAFVCSGLMAFAYFISHANDGLYPILNRGELAVLYCFLWLFVAAQGSGPLSLDAAMRRGRRR